jgi:intracellular multiplication protein IcmB
MLETAEDGITLVAVDGGLMTIIAIDGSTQLIGDGEFGRLVSAAEERLAAQFKRPGHIVQVHYACDPDSGTRVIRESRRGGRAAAEAIGLDLDDLFVAEEQHVGSHVVRDGHHWVLWTTPKCLNKHEKQRATKTRGEKRAAGLRMPAGRGQDPYAAIAALIPLHRSFVAGITDSLRELMLVARVLGVQEALQAVQGDLYPYRECRGQLFSVAGEGLSAPRIVDGGLSVASIGCPPLADQICVEGAALTDGDGSVLPTGMVRIGRRLWAGIDIVYGPKGEAPPFPRLVERLRHGKVPFRVSFLIESGGQEGLGVRKFLAELASISSSNRPIKDAMTWLKHIADAVAVVRMRVSLATWGPVGQPGLVEDRVAQVQQAIGSWREAVGRSDCGDALEGVMSSALGLHCASTAVMAVLPLGQALRMLPWQLVCSPFARGSVLFRTPEGRLWRLGMGGDGQKFRFWLIHATPGAGKSVFLGTTSLGAVLADGMTEVPYIVHLDVGVSGFGFPSLIRDALPGDRQGLARNVRIKMAPQYAINPFDLELGARRPSTDEREAMIGVLVAVWTPAGRKTVFPGAIEIAGQVLDELFRRFDDDEVHNAQPKQYVAGEVAVVDRALRERGLHVPAKALWYHVCDMLFAAGAIDAARVAHRHAVPLMGDVTDVILHASHIRQNWEKRTVGDGSVELLLDALVAQTEAAIREFSILAQPTAWDVAAPIVVVDLQDVVSGEGPAGAYRGSIVYVLMMHALTRRWWRDPDEVGHLPAMYHDHHRVEAAHIKAAPKVLKLDEFHRTAGREAPRLLLLAIARIGRKYNVAIELASQLISDFDDDMVRLATALFMLSGGDGEEVTALAARYDLSEEAQRIARTGLSSPRPGIGAPCLAIVKTAAGWVVGHVFNHLSPVLVWALSTTPADMEIRGKLTRLVGAKAARNVLAKRFPDGTANQWIGGEVAKRLDDGGRRSSADAVKDDLVAELAAEVRRGMAV